MKHHFRLLWGALGAACCLATASLTAHPDHTVTQAGVVEPVPSTEAPPDGARVEITIEGDQRVIVANGLPDHATGAFPNANNPNRIKAQQYRYTVPLHPIEAENPIPQRGTPFGIALNGVLFDPGTAEAWQNDMRSGWNYDAMGGAFSLGLDTNNAHVQPQGAYHYHGIPVDLLKRLSGGEAQMTLIGWAADGFPVYGQWGYREADDPSSGVVELKSGYQLKKGQRPTSDGQPGGTYDGVFVQDFEYTGSGDLDECSGRYGVTPEFPEGTYYYVLTTDFPFIPRYFKGVPDRSFMRKGPPPGGRRPPSARGNWERGKR